jgi:hypothetical protein
MENTAITEKKAKAAGPHSESGRMRAVLYMKLSRMGAVVASVGVNDLRIQKESLRLS